MLRRHPRLFVVLAVWAGAASGCSGCCGNDSFSGPSGGCNLNFNLDFDAGPGHLCNTGPVPHGRLVEGWFGGCGLECDPGWSNCDGDETNGCETEGDCSGIQDAGETVDGAFAVLNDRPRGLAICSGVAFVLDGPSLIGVPLDGGTRQTLFTGDPGAGGLACDGVTKYWATANGGVGQLLSYGADAGTSLLASGIDPGRGIDVDDSGVYWIARSWLDGGGGLAQTPFGDAAASLLAPGQEGPVYKTFALGTSSLFTIADGSVYETVDGSTEIPPGSTTALALATAGSDEIVLTREDAGLTLRTIMSGALGPPLSFKVTSAPRAMVATTDAIYVAFDDRILRVDAITAVETTLVLGALHIADLAVDDIYVYWTTLGDSVQPSSLWRTPR